jgi:hypothetical protein
MVASPMGCLIAHKPSAATDPAGRPICVRCKHPISRRHLDSRAVTRWALLCVTAGVWIAAGILAGLSCLGCAGAPDSDQEAAIIAWRVCAGCHVAGRPATPFGNDQSQHEHDQLVALIAMAMASVNNR